jgi:integrase
MAETGLRAGEVAGLRVQDIGLDCITVSQSVWSGKEQTPKTQSAVRKIAISPQLSEMLWKQVERQIAAGHSFLFSVSTGSPIDMNVERRRRLKPTLKALGIPEAGWLSRVSALQRLRAGFLAGPAKDDSRAHRSRTDRKLHPGCVWAYARLESKRGSSTEVGRRTSEGRC